MAKNSNSNTAENQYQDSSASSFGDRFSGLGDSASRQIDNSPLVAVGAGLALGAVLAAVLPASRKEREMLGPVGAKMTEAGYGAADRAREMGKQKFDELAGDKVREFFGMSESSSGNANA
jgi:hypothetical protein